MVADALGIDSRSAGDTREQAVVLSSSQLDSPLDVRWVLLRTKKSTPTQG